MTRLIPSSSLIIIVKPFNVLMVKRSRMQPFANAFSFPGGKLDDADRLDHIATTSPIRKYLSLSQTSHDYKMAALRESFEEAGDIDGLEQLKIQRLNQRKNPQGFSAVLDRLLGNGQIKLKPLYHFQQWLTPDHPFYKAKRFDTHFFISVISKEEHNMLKDLACPDQHEITEMNYWAPQKALELYQNGSIDLFPPQFVILHQLAKYGSSEELLQDLKTRAPVPLILPKFKQTKEDGLCTVLPGDHEYEDVNANHVTRKFRVKFGPLKDVDASIFRDMAYLDQ